MKATVIPAVHAEGRRLPDYPEGGAPREALTALAREHGEVYVVDVEGVRANRPDIDFLREVTRNLPVWVDSGPRYADDAMDALVAGAERLTVRWNTLASRSELDDLAEIGDEGSFLVGLEFTRDGFLANPRERLTDAATVAKAATALRLGLVVQAPRFDLSLARRLAEGEGARWWYGELTREDAVELMRLGYDGVVVPAPIARNLGQLGRDEEGTRADEGDAGTGARS